MERKKPLSYMAIKQITWCDQCGKILHNPQEKKVHRATPCLTVKEGDRVTFQYLLVSGLKGTITSLGPTVEKPGAPRLIFIKADEQICDADWSQGESGYDVQVTLADIQAKEPVVTTETKIPARYQGVCPKCQKTITATEEEIMLSGSPPEFPHLKSGHCQVAVPMSFISQEEPTIRK